MTWTPTFIDPIINFASVPGLSTRIGNNVTLDALAERNSLLKQKKVQHVKIHKILKKNKENYVKHPPRGC